MDSMEISCHKKNPSLTFGRGPKGCHGNIEDPISNTSIHVTIISHPWYFFGQAVFPVTPFTSSML